MLEKLKQEVYEANLLLPEHGLVTLSWGNVSGIDDSRNYMVIKPSGVDYAQMKPEDMTVVSVADGQVVEGELRPSSDTETHLELYRHCDTLGGIAHTHSRWATIFAQSCRPILPYGTTHADFAYGAVPCTRLMTKAEVNGAYELNTGKVIVETFMDKPFQDIPAVLVACHGPFTWGKSAKDAVKNAVVLEEVAFMAWHSQLLQPGMTPIEPFLLDKHYLRKHGEYAYYGQREEII